MLTNIALREKIDKYVDKGLYDINCKQYHDEMIEALNSNKDEKKNYTYNSSYNYTSDYNTSVNNNTIYSSRKNYGNTNSSKITEEEKGNAVAIAQTEIKGRLKSPSSAKFPWSFDEYTITKSGKTFIVKSYVEAKNSFGTLLKINYLIKFTMTGYETYTVDSIVIDE
mgnify:CR=1 FL=1